MTDFAFTVAAIIIFLLFYAVFFAKMIAQRRRGIVTNQMGKGTKDVTLKKVEQLLAGATFFLAGVQAASIFGNLSWLPPVPRIFGVIIALIGDVIFASAVFTMKDSWRAGIPEKSDTELVTGGIYRYSRNPAFLGFYLMYGGILLTFFNPIHAVAVCFAGVIMHMQVLQEEKYLPVLFGSDYEVYKKHVSRYVGRHESE